MEAVNTTTGLILLETPPNNFSQNGTNISVEFKNDILNVNDEYKPIIDYLLLAVLIVIMLSMGCEITWAELKVHLFKPIGIGIGMASQFFIKPLTAFAMMQGIHVSSLHATGVLIIACCPGGVLSNAFTYYCDGDLSLSVAMTTISTLLAMGMMPLNLWIYGRSFETQDLTLPYASLALSIISITTPVFVGMVLRWKLPKLSKIVTKVGSSIGILLVVACIVLEVIVFPNMFTGVPGKLYGLILTLPVIGFAIGYGLSYLFKQTAPIHKTIGIECAVQNVPTALSVISLSFKAELQGDIILLPWLYGFAMMTGCAVLCIMYQIRKRYLARKAQTEKAITINMQENVPNGKF